MTTKRTPSSAPSYVPLRARYPTRSRTASTVITLALGVGVAVLVAVLQIGQAYERRQATSEVRANTHQVAAAEDRITPGSTDQVVVDGSSPISSPRPPLTVSAELPEGPSWQRALNPDSQPLH